MGVRATTGAFALEAEKVVGKSLSCSLGPLNYHMAIRIVVCCVNIPVFSRRNFDIESTVHSPKTWFLASQQHIQGESWTWGSISLFPPQRTWHLSTAVTPICTSQSPIQPKYLRDNSRSAVPVQASALPIPHALFGPGWRLGSWKTTGWN